MDLGKWFRGNRRRQPSTPLYDFVERIKPELAIVQLEGGYEESSTKMSRLIATLGLSITGHFLAQHSKLIIKFYGPFNRDVLCFECIVFFHHALRAYYEQSEYEDYTDDRFETYFDSFQNATDITRSLIDKYLVGSNDDVFAHRYNTYLKAPSIEGQKGSGEHFRFMLQTLKGAETPQETYGPVSLDLAKTLQMIALVQAYSAAYIPTYSTMLTKLIEEYAVVPD